MEDTKSFFVRKLKHRRNMELIKEAADSGDVIADVIEEFNIKNGSLSVWEIFDTSRDELSKAVLAIAICFKQLADMDFLLIDKDYMNINSLMLKNEPSEHGLSQELERRHYNITDLTIKDIKNCVSAIKNVLDNDNLDDPHYIVRYCSEDIFKLISEAYQNKTIKKEDIDSQLFNHLKKKDGKLFTSN